MDNLSRINNLPREKRLLLIQKFQQHLMSTGKGEVHKQNSAPDPASPEIEVAKPSSRLLSAYIVLNRDEVASSLSIREYLNQKLPYYMVPNNLYLIDSIPLMPNGKVDRTALSHLKNDDRQSEEKHYVSPRNPVEETLAKIWGDVLNIQQIGIHDNFFELGGDSILSIQIISRTRQEGLRHSANQLFQKQTIAELAPLVQSESTTLAEQGLVTGQIAITPIQSWFFEHYCLQPAHWNQSLLLNLDSSLSFTVVEQAIRFLLSQHDALRMQFSRQGGQWNGSILGMPESTPIDRFDLTEHESGQHLMVIDNRASEIHRSLDLAKGTLFQATFFDTAESGKNYLLLIIHHLVVDAVSWRILLEDLDELLNQAGLNKPLKLSGKTSSFKAWSLNINAHANSEFLKQEISYWSRSELKNPALLPVDFQASRLSNTIKSLGKISATLSVTETDDLLTKTSTAYNTRVNDLLVTALAQTIHSWSATNALVFGLEGHGREEIFDELDLSRTVGWFTSYFPVSIVLDDPSDPGKAIVNTKEQLRGIPGRGIDYGLLRYCCQDADVQKNLASNEPELCFNFLGKNDQQVFKSGLQGISNELPGQARNLDEVRPYLLEFNASISSNQFQIECAYSTEIHQKNTIENFLSVYIDKLSNLILHCLSASSSRFTSSDFPLADLDDGEFSKLSSLIDGLDETQGGGQE